MEAEIDLRIDKLHEKSRAAGTAEVGAADEDVAWEETPVQSSGEIFGLAVHAARKEAYIEQDQRCAEAGAIDEHQNRQDGSLVHEVESTAVDENVPWHHRMSVEWWNVKTTELFHRYDLDDSGSISADTEELLQLCLKISWQLQEKFEVRQPNVAELESLIGNLGEFDQHRNALSLEQFQRWYLSEVLPVSQPQTAAILGTTQGEG